MCASGVTEEAFCRQKGQEGRVKGGGEMKLRKLKGKKKSSNEKVAAPARRGRQPSPKIFVPFFSSDDYETEKEVFLLFSL